MSRKRAVTIAALGCVAGVLAFTAGIALGPSTAVAGVPINSFSAGPTTTQAGGHADIGVAFSIKNRVDQQTEEGKNTPCDCEDAKDILVHLPAGVIGNPHATPQCTVAQLYSSQCPVDSQVGVAWVGVNANSDVNFVSPVFNLVPRPGQAGLLAFKIFFSGFIQFTELTARTGSDYGLDARAESIFHSIPVNRVYQVVWGVPASPQHDALRMQYGGDVTFGGANYSVGGVFCDAEGKPSSREDPRTVTNYCHFGGTEPQVGPPFDVASNSPERPFLQNPTTCGEALTSYLDIIAYDNEETHASAPYPPTTGCDQLTFNPSLAAQPTTTEADSPSGIDVHLNVPQTQSPTVPAPSEIRGTEMTLPEGFSINPSAADGKTSCTNAQARFGSEDEAQCPEFSKIGSLTIESAVLPGVLPGYAYLGEPLPGNRYRVILVADGFGVHIKLPGTVVPDPRTGQLRVLFKDLPQAPFQDFNLHFFGSERGALATPTRCGTYPVTTTFTPWDNVLPDQSATQFFTVDRGPNGTPCPGAQRPFDPGFQAASEGNTAGAFSEFAVDLQRPDGDQYLSGLEVSTPPGFSGVLKGIPYCPEQAIQKLNNPAYSGVFEQAAPSCPSASRLGKAIAGAGAGSRPFYAPGDVYLAGPYKGAPLSLVVVIPAVSGPYDLGNVAVRAAIHVNPRTARVTTVSDPLPQIIEGIPLRTRSIRVELDRPKFAITPTNCDPLSTEATVHGSEGGVAKESSHYQVANCANLGFRPRLEIALRGGTKRAQNPALKATLRPRPGDANLAGAIVTLPASQFLDNSHIKGPCTRVQYNANQCPATSVYGYARATSPLIDGELKGPVYLRSNGGERLLPDLVFKLQGQIDVEVVGFVDSVEGRLRSTFASVPDVPVSSFTLQMKGGAKGLLENSEDLCEVPSFAKARFSGQNGKALTINPKVKVDCGAKAKKRAKRILRAKVAG
jgi:hypothetical protein